MECCNPRSADSAPSTRSAPTCSNSRNDRQPHAKLSSPRPGARCRSTPGRPCLRTETSETSQKTCENFPYAFKGGTRRRAARPGAPGVRPLRPDPPRQPDRAQETSTIRTTRRSQQTGKRLPGSICPVRTRSTKSPAFRPSGLDTQNGHTEGPRHPRCRWYVTKIT
jgi:hypothetical protein